MAKLIGKAVQGLSVGIGLAGEKYYDRKERKAAIEAQGQSSGSTELNIQEQEPSRDRPNASDELLADDERMWALDEAAGSPPPYEATEPNPDHVIEELAYNVAVSRNRQMHDHPGETLRLTHPVIIPQRRPGSKVRGWTRAYAPDLQRLGIEQDTFMKFLKSWDSVIQGSKWFRTISLASSVVSMAIPTPIVMGITTAVSIAAEAGQEFHGRYKSNSFLDQMNKEVFMPAGIYAMVIVCKQDASALDGIQLSIDTVNLENAKNISKYAVPESNGQLPPPSSNTFKRSIRMASGKSNVDEMPLEIAPLIYPDLDDMIRRPELPRDESFKQRIMRNKDFVADYFDRRAQADFAGNNPNAALTKASGDMPEFKTRFGDPNAACNNGHLISLVTGGKVVVQDRGSLASRGGGRLGSGQQRGGLLGSSLGGGRQEFGTVDTRGGRSVGGLGGLLDARSRSHDGSRGGLLGARSGLLAARQGRGFPGRSYEEDDAYDGRRGSHGHRQGRESQTREVGPDGKLLPRQKQPETQPRGPIQFAMKGVKKVMKPDVMYLTIVNLPTEEEMELAKAALGVDKKGWQEIIEGLRRR